MSPNVSKLLEKKSIKKDFGPRLNSKIKLNPQILEKIEKKKASDNSWEVFVVDRKTCMLRVDLEILGIEYLGTDIKIGAVYRGQLIHNNGLKIKLEEELSVDFQRDSTERSRRYFSNNDPIMLTEKSKFFNLVVTAPFSVTDANGKTHIQVIEEESSIILNLIGYNPTISTLVKKVSKNDERLIRIFGIKLSSSNGMKNIIITDQTQIEFSSRSQQRNTFLKVKHKMDEFFNSDMDSEHLTGEVIGYEESGLDSVRFEDDSKMEFSSYQEERDPS